MQKGHLQTIKNFRKQSCQKKIFNLTWISQSFLNTYLVPYPVPLAQYFEVCPWTTVLFLSFSLLSWNSFKYEKLSGFLWGVADKSANSTSTISRHFDCTMLSFGRFSESLNNSNNVLWSDCVLPSKASLERPFEFADLKSFNRWNKTARQFELWTNFSAKPGE